jgi:hypothetical protein
VSIQNNFCDHQVLANFFGLYVHESLSAGFRRVRPQEFPIARPRQRQTKNYEYRSHFSNSVPQIEPNSVYREISSEQQLSF